MRNDPQFQRLAAFLETLPVDATDEISLLRGLERGEAGHTLLVAGEQAGDPFSLMAGLGLENPLPGDAAPDCPIECGYGDTFSLAVRSARGERDRFFSARDFQQAYRGRYAEIAEISLTAPSALIKGRRALFLLLTDLSTKNIPSVAGRCRNFVIALPCDGGAPGPRVTQLCCFVRDALGMANRCRTVLNHAEQTLFVNDGLGDMMDALLGGAHAPFECRHAPGGEAPRAVLAAALQSIAAEPDRGACDVAAQRSVQGVLDKLAARARALEAEKAQEEARAAAFTKARGVFSTEAQNSRYALRDLLSDDERHEILLEIQAMTLYLKERLPGLAQEVAARSEDPKADLKNLGADYVARVLNDFLSALTREVADEVLGPRAEKVFHTARARFALLARALSLECGDTIVPEESELALLKSANLNLGDYHTALAQYVGLSLALITRIALGSELGVAFHAVIGKLSNALEGKVTSLVDAVTPKAQYAAAYAKALGNQLDSASEDIFRAVNDSLLPRIYALLEERYDAMTDCYDASLKDRAASHERAARALEQSARENEAYAGTLAAFLQRGAPSERDA